MSTRWKRGVTDQSWVPKSLKHLSCHLHGHVTKAWPRQNCCASTLNSTKLPLYIKIHSFLSFLLSQWQFTEHGIFPDFYSQKQFYFFSIFSHTVLLHLLRPTFFFLSIWQIIVCVPLGTHLRTPGSKSSTTTSHSLQELSKAFPKLSELSSYTEYHTDDSCCQQQAN